MPPKNRRPFVDPNDCNKRNGSDNGICRVQQLSAQAYRAERELTGPRWVGGGNSTSPKPNWCHGAFAALSLQD